MNYIVLAVIVVAMNGDAYLTRFLEPFVTPADCEAKLAVVEQWPQGVLLRQFANDGIAIKEVHLACMTVDEYKGFLKK